jgi:hypothetical protein
MMSDVQSQKRYTYECPEVRLCTEWSENWKQVSAGDVYAKYLNNPQIYVLGRVVSGVIGKEGHSQEKLSGPRHLGWLASNVL